MNNRLTDEEKWIMFNKGTEAPFTGALLNEKRDGMFYCKNCGEALFLSDTKFDSKSGWPSFTNPADSKNVVLTEDTSHGMQRVEVACAHCGAHLGHVFDDGPIEDGGLRYCINSASLQFDPKEHKS